MKRIIQSLNRIFHGNKRQMFTAAAAAVIVYVVLLSGIFSYFHGGDAVSNRITAAQGSVTIIEPEWDRQGQNMAKNAEPGMMIPKDPAGFNNSEMNVYIRLVMTVETVEQAYYEQNCSLPASASEEGEITKKSAAERLTAIVNAIKNIDDENSAGQLLTIDGDQQITSCNHAKFVCDHANKSQEDNKLTYYFYYTDGDKDGTDADLMHCVAPNDQTAALFQRVDIPIYKKEYLGVFDFAYNISLTAEAIPVGDDTVLTVEAAKDKF